MLQHVLHVYIGDSKSEDRVSGVWSQDSPPVLFGCHCFI